ncbi:MAG: hypothetical protein A2Y81_03615 [Nitrospirae bacterium RBG_13_43_8]|nr:MAG: hypothetical protein A2Y81_03615 [Nitrospirae bacterium RBG_13_43_8]
MSKECEILHNIFSSMARHKFPFDSSLIPQNGIYVLFQESEIGHGAERIVRVGTHTGNNQLRSRLKQHFLNENKDRSIFRKNIGRAILRKIKDPFLEQWEIDLTARKFNDKYSRKIDFDRQKEIESKVSQYIQKNFSFSVFQIEDKTRRLEIESKLISTVSLCNNCKPSSEWLGNYSPKVKIRESGLWLVNELYKTPFTLQELKQIEKQIKG